MTKYHEFQYHYNTCEEVYNEKCGFENTDDCKNCELLHEDLKDEALMDFAIKYPKRVAIDIFEDIGSLDMINRYITVTVESEKE